jgi:hypothetical protein
MYRGTVAFWGDECMHVVSKSTMDEVMERLWEVFTPYRH